METWPPPASVTLCAVLCGAGRPLTFLSLSTKRNLPFQPPRGKRRFPTSPSSCPHCQRKFVDHIHIIVMVMGHSEKEAKWWTDTCSSYTQSLPRYRQNHRLRAQNPALWTVNTASSWSGVPPPLQETLSFSSMLLLPGSALLHNYLTPLSSCSSPSGSASSYLSAQASKRCVPES